MISRTLVKHALSSEAEIPDMLVQGWVRTRRDSKAFSFLEINDGSSVASLQVVADEGIPGYERIAEMTTGAAVSVRGALAGRAGAALGIARLLPWSWSAPLRNPTPSRRRGTRRVPRSIAHLRPRTNLFGAVFRMRSRLAAVPPPVFPVPGLCLGQYAHHHRQRLRRGGGNVPRDDAGRG